MQNTQHHINVLVHNLCRPRGLPVLATDIIASYLDKSVIHTLSKVSKKLNEYAMPLGYHDIKLDSGRRTALLLRTLLTNTLAAECVRTLVLSGDMLLSLKQGTTQANNPAETVMELPAFTPREIELQCKLTDTCFTTIQSLSIQVALPKLCLNIISLCSQLEDLSISSVYLRSEITDTFEAMAKTGDFGSLKNLRTCRLCFDLLTEHPQEHPQEQFDIFQAWDHAALMPLSAPNIETLSVAMTLAPGITNGLRATSITRLTLHHCQEQESSLDDLFSAMPKLRYLEYLASVNVDWWRSLRRRNPDDRPDIGLELLYRSLYRLKDTLEELVAGQVYICANEYFREGGLERGHGLPDRHLNNLSIMGHLHTLSIPYMSLLGREAKDASRYDWHATLPRLLRSLTLTDHLAENDCNYQPTWDDASLLPAFTSLLDAMVVFRSGPESSRFALVFHQSGCEDVTRSTQEKLDALCQDRDISFSVEKLADECFSGEYWPPNLVGSILQKETRIVNHSRFLA